MRAFGVGCQAQAAPHTTLRARHLAEAAHLAAAPRQQGCWARPPPRQHRRDLAVRVRAIGFDLPGAEQSNKSAEKSAEELTRGAASLLLYSQVLKGKPAQVRAPSLAK